MTKKFKRNASVDTTTSKTSKDRVHGEASLESVKTASSTKSGAVVKSKKINPVLADDLDLRTYIPPSELKIKSPSRRPFSLATKSKRPAMSEQMEKQLRQKEILAIMRGQVTLPTAFRQKYQITEALGDGAFGFVFAATILDEQTRLKCEGKKEAAVKFILREKVSEDNWVLDDEIGQWIPFECHFLKQVRHPSIIRFLDLYMDAKYIYLVTELHGTQWSPNNPELSPDKNPGVKAPVKGMDIGEMGRVLSKEELAKMSDEELTQRRRVACDLFECIDCQYDSILSSNIIHSSSSSLSLCSNGISEDIAKKIFTQIVEAIDYMHQAGFVHRDIKDENIVIDAQYRIKIIDFGSTARIPEYGNKSKYFDRFNGTLHFASPEILTGQHYRGPEAEVWALGVLLYTIMYAENPFSTTEASIRAQPKYPTAEQMQAQGKDYAKVNGLIRRCLNAKVETRITMAAIKMHAWFDGYFDKEEEEEEC